MATFNDVMFIAGQRKTGQSFLKEFLCLQDPDYVGQNDCVFQTNREVDHFDKIENLYINSKYLFAISGNLILKLRHSVSKKLIPQV